MTNKEGVVDAGSGTEAQTKIHTESDSNASFLRAARAGNLEKVLEYLKGSIDINTSNANGLNALHLASKEGHVAVVTELVKRGANVNAATKKGNTALHIASLAGQEEVAKILIRSGANPNVQSQNGFTPLYMAAQENHDGVVKFLLANGANQSLATEDGFTPLAVALQQGHDKVVAVLLENDAKGRVRLPALHIAAKKDDCKAAALLLQNDHDPDVTSKSGFTPLHIAAHYGNENIASLLLEKNADVNYSAKHQITPLHVAAKWGKSNMVTLLIDKGAKIDASTRDGLTPLHCAARSGHDQVVDLLLEKGAPITAKTKNGLAPLHMASQGDHVDSARILLYHKAPVDDVTVDYLTALHVAAHCGHVRVAKLLLDRKADPNARALNGFTPLHIACKKNRIKVVELLLKHGASIEATTESGLTPLHVASFMGCMNIVIYLIQHGANPDVPTVRGETPLHLAARANQSDIIRILLRNGAHVDASAREQQTPLHIAARLGNVDIVGLLLQHGAAVDATTKDMYTALHIAAKEGQEEVASVLLDHGASLTATTKKGFTPLHLAAKYGNIKVARLLLQKDAPVDAQGKNGVTPLHVAAHYDHVNVALLLLDKGAFPHATAKNGYTPLHIAAKKNQMDIATTLLEYGAKPNAESKAGFTPLHLAAQEGHTDMTTLLIEHHADVNSPAKNGLSPLHLCSQEDKVNVAAILVKNGAKIDPQTKAGYTPLHVACHFGQINMIRFLLQHGADVNAITSHGYTPLHQAAQQGHTLIINLLLEHKASPNTTTNQGQTALSIAQRLGYISVVETLKIVTETIVTTTTTTVTEEKYKVVAPETMQETFMSDSEDEGAEDTMLGDQSLHYMTTDELKALADDNTLGIDVTRDERGTDSTLIAPLTAEEDHLTPQHVVHQEATFNSSIAADNVDLTRAPVHAGFLVSFMVDARGGAMRGCRHSGVRVIIPPRKAPMPMRITCRYLRKEKLAYPPPLMEGEACASRILEVGPSGAKFLGPVIIEVPHFASLRGREREITILRSDNGETWREHTLEASDDAVHDVFNESFEGEELTAIEDLSTNRITRILTTDFPQYFAIITRIRQEVHAIGPEGGMVSSTVVPQVQAIFPEGALTKKIKVGLQAQPITPELVTKLLGNRVAVSPIVTVEPRRRKFHKPITLTIPVPQAATKGMINQYSGDAPTLRLLCSITGGTTKAQWEDVTGSTPLTFVNDCVSFTTTVSARFWLMDCRQVNEATKFATELYREAIHVPFMAKFVVFAKRHDPLEAQLRVFCMTDDKEDKTLESQEHFTEVAKSRDVEVLEGKPQYLEFAGNLVPVTKSGEQLSLTFQAFRENRLPFTIRVKDPHQEPMGRVAFMREPRVGRGEPPQLPICNLNIVLPEADLTPVSELVTLEKKYGFVTETSLAKPELIHRANLRLSDIAKELKEDWVLLALQLDLPESDINSIRSDNPDDTTQQALAMLRRWLQRAGSKANGNFLEKGLRKINREDIVNQCMFNVELVTDDVEKAVAKVHLDQSGFDTFKEELGSSRDASLRRETSLNGTYDEQDIMKDAESAAETSSESSEKDPHFRGEGRHTEKRSEERAAFEDVSHTAAKAFEEGPETLVQNVPTALAESFTQNMSNGQLSDASIHEEDRSEPTVATLSSEATAEMEVSSLEDKSQAETRVEKKEKTNILEDMKCFRGQISLNSNLCRISMKDTPRNVKLQKQLKRSTYIEVPTKQCIFDVYSRTLTPVSQKRKKIIARRNTWPSDSPQKLNKRKRYQQRLKIGDLKEPFWTDTYQWLTELKCSPEELKTAPLANFLEFEEYINNSSNLKYTHYSKGDIFSAKNKYTDKTVLSHAKPVEVMPFYFIKYAKMKSNYKDKMYLQQLRNRCLLSSLKSCIIPSIKPTNFLDVACNENKLASDSIVSKETNVSEYTEPLNNIIATVDINDSCDCSFHEVNESPMASRTNIYIQDRESYISSARPSLRPLNSESSTEVLSCNYVSDYNNQFNIKQKMLMKNSFCNKENVIKLRSSGFPNAKYPEHGDKMKKPFLSASGGQILKKGQRNVVKHDLTNKEFPNQNTYKSDLDEKFYALPKNIKIKTNPCDITEDVPQDMLSPDAPNSKKNSSAAKASSDVSSKNSASVTMDSTSVASTGCQISSSGSSQTSSGLNQSKPYARQLFEKDIQSNFSKSSIKNKGGTGKKTSDDKEELEEIESKELKNSEEQQKPCQSEDDLTFQKAVKQEILNESTLKQDISQTIPAAVVGQSFLKSLQERIEPEENVKEQTFPASVIGQVFLSSLLEQQLKSEGNAHDTQMSVAASSGKTYAKSVSEEYLTHEKQKEHVIPAEVLGQAFLKNLVSKSHYSDVKDNEGVEGEKPEQEKNLPASVIGQAFLKTLTEQSKIFEESSVTKPVPASVIGQTFIKTLTSESTGCEVSTNVPATSAISSELSETLLDSPKSELPFEKMPIPATVVGQTFLKTLFEQSQSQNYNEEMKVSASTDQTLSKTLAKQDEITDSLEEKPIPASVVSQTFLKSLLQQSEAGKIKEDKLIPASVVGQSFLKCLTEQQKTEEHAPEKVIPASVVGQTFLKCLTGQQKAEEEEIEKVMPASVVGQTFLKFLTEQQKTEEHVPEKVIPAFVVGQTFLKCLTEQQKTEEEAIEKVIPASVVGQAFLKCLTEQQKPKEEAIEKVIPSSVVGQTFLKCLTEQQKTEEAMEKVIPASVVGQTFLKCLTEQQKTEEAIEKVIPASVVGQTFLKSLLQAGEAEEPAAEMPVPASVIGQLFLKSLKEHDMTQGVSQEKIIPASVVGQSFLKSLVEQTETIEYTGGEIRSSAEGCSFQKALGEQSETGKSAEEMVIPASVVGQAFLKALVEKESVQSSEETSIQSSVLSQCFLKSLTEQSKSQPERKPIPASVIGQSFLKSLTENSITEEVSDEKVIPASVVGQAFLKSLIENETAKSEEKKPIPASVIGQSFLKSLTEHTDVESEVKPVPASVVSQVFLKTLCDQESQKQVESEKAIPSSVVSHTFLKSLLEHEPKDIQQKQNLPSSVIAQTFLKSLVDQESHSDSSESYEQLSPKDSSEKSMPASVVGQAFLRTLFSMTSNQASAAVDPPFSKDISQVHIDASQTKQQHDLGKDNCSNIAVSKELYDTSQCSIASEKENLASCAVQSELYEEQSTIIPPPPEFRSTPKGDETHPSESAAASEAPSPSTVTSSGIIGELISYTKMMHSVIESMKEDDTSDSTTVQTSNLSDSTSCQKK